MILRDWTEARAQRATLLRLKKIEELLGDIGALWGDVDEYIVQQCDDLIRDFRERQQEWLAWWAARAEEERERSREERPS